MTDHGHAFARSLVDGGRFASLSAVIQHGLGLVEREEEEHRARLAALAALHKNCYPPAHTIPGAGALPMFVDKINPGVNPPHPIQWTQTLA